jgi:hypothetical protein
MKIAKLKGKGQNQMAAVEVVEVERTNKVI